VAIWWYDILEKQIKELDRLQDVQDTVQWQSAVDMMKELFERRWSIKTHDFLLEFIKLAFQSEASDLHFQSEQDFVHVKLRIDGVLHEILSFEHDDFAQYLTKLKFMSGIKMNVDALPQDGRFTFSTRVHGMEESVDVRVSTLPWLYLDGVVMRFLQWTQSFSHFEDLWITQDNIARITKVLDKKYGMIFVTWPTGSWKTTTLYTMLNYINDGTKKIITLENPVEYQLNGVQQSQIDEAKGYTYELGLKSVLRHDPDVILVWETRSHETAETVINASLTGHMVFTTVHTDNALDTIVRMLSMGVEPYLFAPVVSLICSQRLVRRVCPHCMKIEKALSFEEDELKIILADIARVRPDLNIPFPEGLVKAVWCVLCNGTGYRGRIALSEVLPIEDEMRELILDSAHVKKIFEIARKRGFLTMKEDGMLKVLEWLTSMDELRLVM